MFTDKEINKIFSWLPYRDSWPINGNKKGNSIEYYYGEMILRFKNNPYFETYYAQEGGVTNYLEFICYPRISKLYNGNSISVYISLCAPLAVYGQTSFHKTSDGCGYNFIEVDSVGIITDDKLKEIETEIKNILSENNLLMIDQEYAAKPLPKEVAANLESENLNKGNQYLHGLFQFSD